MFQQTFPIIQFDALYWSPVTELFVVLLPYWFVSVFSLTLEVTLKHVKGNSRVGSVCNRDASKLVSRFPRSQATVLYLLALMFYKWPINIWRQVLILFDSQDFWRLLIQLCHLTRLSRQWSGRASPAATPLANNFALSRCWAKLVWQHLLVWYDFDIRKKGRGTVSGGVLHYPAALVCLSHTFPHTLMDPLGVSCPPSYTMIAIDCHDRWSFVPQKSINSRENVLISLLLVNKPRPISEHWIDCNIHFSGIEF